MCFMLAYILVVTESLPLLQEINRQCHQHIRDHHRWCCQVTGCQHALPCIFRDIMELVPLNARGVDGSFLEKKHAIYSRPMVQKQPCFAHKDRTKCVVPHTDYDFSGLPCTDNSTAKHHRQYYEGPSGPIFATWALRLKRHDVKLAVLENTPEPRPTQSSPQQSFLRCLTFQIS